MFGAFKGAVVGNRDRNGLRRNARCKIERASNNTVVGRGGRRVGLPCVVDRCALRQIAGTGHREGDCASRFVNGEVVDREARTVVVGGAATR